ncbi:MAG TPA: UDP-N-acetylglucosamine 2-epimerase (non-hydrolyzing) [Alphaproteobacteria bacterium]|nr:UDP-N-acetylglucosamine 2-epimerase (non-hydrolyzing) [Alphaproteobacteria bacterium]
MKVMTVVGARPQFIKAAPVSRALCKAGQAEILVHTGQHYDYGMSQVFFDELGLPQPAINLGVGSGNQGWQTGQTLIRLEEVMLAQQPDVVLVYGDTNSTLAGALAAAKLHIPVVHVEAGLRSFNRKMPEEVNRVLTDHLSAILFCPTVTAVKNLAREGIIEGVHLVGDVMHEAVRYNLGIAQEKSRILKKLSLHPKRYILATVHRMENTEQPEHLENILKAFADLANLGKIIVFPAHPRTKKKLENFKKISHPRLLVVDPIPYHDMLVLEKFAKVILTDSGGVQREAFWMKVPCVILRNETEWIETVGSGWNVLAGTDIQKIVNTTKDFLSINRKDFSAKRLEKNVSKEIVELLIEYYTKKSN